MASCFQPKGHVDKRSVAQTVCFFFALLFFILRDTGCLAALWSSPGDAHQETSPLLQPGRTQSMRLRLYPEMNKILPACRRKTWRDHVIGWIMSTRPGITTGPQVGSIVLGVLERKASLSICFRCPPCRTTTPFPPTYTQGIGFFQELQTMCVSS